MKKEKEDLQSIFFSPSFFLFMFLLLFCSSPPKAAAASAPSSVKLQSLPGFSGPLPFHMETGYVGVGESEEDLLFYYFVESEKNPEEDPVLVWITGGPGCSAWSGLVYEIGPLKFETQEYNGSLPTLTVNEYSWTKVSSIIFLDAPIWTGFSYSRRSRDVETGDFKSSEEVHQFTRKWLKDHPKFLSNPFYIGGDSYSGLIVPVIVQDIANGNDAGQKPLINLKGYLEGNPSTDDIYDVNARVPYLHGVGIIPDDLYELTKKDCKGNYLIPSSEECKKGLDEVYKCTWGLNTVHILEPLCFFASPKPPERGGRRFLKDSGLFLSQPPDFQDCRSYGYLLSYFWANDERVRKALGIHKGSIEQWMRCNYGIRYKHEITSAIPYHRNLTTNGFRALIYSGDHDMSIPHVGSQAWIRSLNYQITDEWRSWIVDGQIGGYTRTYANKMTFATIKGGGHTAPEYKPKESLAMLDRWISEKPL